MGKTFLVVVNQVSSHRDTMSSADACCMGEVSIFIAAPIVNPPVLVFAQARISARLLSTVVLLIQF